MRHLLRIVAAVIVLGLLLAACATQPKPVAKPAASLGEAIATQYLARGENQKTADCLGRVMTFAIPAGERPGILAYMNGQGGDAASYKKWIVIGHERDRPELVDTMFGDCPVEFEEFAQRGSFH